MTIKKGNVGHKVLGKSWAAWVGAWFVDLPGIPCIPSSLSTEFDRVLSMRASCSSYSWVVDLWSSYK